MTIILADKEKVEADLQARFGDRLRTGKPKKNTASSYFWDKRERFLHQNMKRLSLQANTGGR